MFKCFPPATTTKFKFPSNRHLLLNTSHSTELSPTSCTTSRYNSSDLPLPASRPLSAPLFLQNAFPVSVPSDSFSFALLSAVLSLRLPSLAPQLHSLLVKSLPLSSSLLPFTSLLQLYPPLHALRLFAEIPHPDPPVYNSLISCLVDNSLVAKAMSTFRAMLHSGVRSTASTLCTLLKAHGLHLSQGKQIHARVCITGCESVVLATALVGFYSRLGMVEDAVNVFNGSSGEKDEGIYNALLSGFVMNRRFEDVFLMVRRMEVNPVALSSVLNVCSELYSLEYGRQVHCLIGGYEEVYPEANNQFLRENGIRLFQFGIDGCKPEQRRCLEVKEGRSAVS
ncbi:uncharacterized protein A4U43_C10F13050 [Asparagus officinalis]|uniref:Pentatricopeptide repeat-containing protein n=1 Tax=Asparagus officinalis TaxID=4686 RepID=A0A5P1E5S1_ASPOF|nr:uncharacterized protein A4U43_C10F13050 [Asparagus officinalis]